MYTSHGSDIDVLKDWVEVNFPIMCHKAVFVLSVFSTLYSVSRLRPAHQMTPLPVLISTSRAHAISPAYLIFSFTSIII